MVVCVCVVFALRHHAQRYFLPFICTTQSFAVGMVLKNHAQRYFLLFCTIQSMVVCVCVVFALRHPAQRYFLPFICTTQSFAVGMVFKKPCAKVFPSLLYYPINGCVCVCSVCFETPCSKVFPSLYLYHPIIYCGDGF